jgi:ADP-ribose pyrophosphatase YjhB (NUDIX family)
VRQAYGSRRWTTPGSAVEVGETPVEALRREVFEEIGCELDVHRFAGVYSKPYRNDIVLSFDVTIRSAAPSAAHQPQAGEASIA